MSDFYSINPATEAIIATHHSTSFSEVDAMIQAMSHDATSWKQSSFEYRCSIIKAFAKEVEAKKEQLARLITEEMGKTLAESMLEVQAVINKCSLSIQAYEQRCKHSSSTQGNKNQVLSYKAIGNVVVLGPYNFPAHLPNGHIVPALLAGNAVIFKASEITTLVGEFYVNCFRAVGLPASVLVFVKGEAALGRYLVEHADIQAVLFTGSYAVGKAISMSLAARPEVLLALEMGGNNPLVIHDYSDFDSLITLVIQSAYLTTGQRCTCARRLILIDDPKREAFIAALTEAVLTLDASFMGPVVSKKAMLNAMHFYMHLLESGATVLSALERRSEKGYFLSPGLLDVTGLSVADEECFGPLLQVIQVSDLSEAIQVANHTAYGLSASLISRSKEAFNRFHAELKAGIINWNLPTNGASSSLPFGGVGHSGNFRPSAFFAADYCSYPVASMQQDQL